MQAAESLGKIDGSKTNTIEPLSAMILVRGDETIVAGGKDNSSDSGNSATDSTSAMNTHGKNADANNSAPSFGSKAGLAAGITLGVLALAGLIALLFRKKK